MRISGAEAILGRLIWESGQVLPDGWTVKTVDGKWAAHYENTILITDGEPEILTAPAI